MRCTSPTGAHASVTMPVRTAVRSWRSTSAPSWAARFLTKRAKHGLGARELVVEDPSRDDERIADLVPHRRALFSGGHDVLGAQDRELLRDGGLIEPQACLKLLNAPLASAQDLEDSDSDRVRQRLEELGLERLEAGRRHTINISKYSYISVLRNKLRRRDDQNANARPHWPL